MNGLGLSGTRPVLGYDFPAPDDPRWRIVPWSIADWAGGGPVRYSVYLDLGDGRGDRNGRIVTPSLRSEAAARAYIARVAGTPMRVHRTHPYSVRPDYPLYIPAEWVGEECGL